MRAFHAICVALTVAAVRGQYQSYRTGHYSYAAPAISTVRTAYVHAAPAITTVAAAPAITRTVAIQAAPAISVAHAPVARIAVAAAPTLSVAAAPAISVAAAPTYAARAVNVGVIATAPAAAIRTHEIHTGSGRQAIRIEDFQAGDQVIRVHEGPQAAPQIAQVQVPGEQHHIRVINHQSGPAHVERVVHRQQTQVVDVQKPGRPGARIVQVVKAESPAPSIEFVNAGGSDHHVYHANDGGAIGGAISVAAAPAISIAAAPAIAVHAAPVIQRSIAVHAAPAISVAAPAYSTRIIGGSSYGGSYGYGRSFGNTVVLHKA